MLAAILPLTLFCSPRNIEEIKAVLKIANDYKIPLWTFSRGKNLG
jgi:UDP-N-acetylenolpyruvoylglucosamine reductase